MTSTKRTGTIVRAAALWLGAAAAFAGDEQPPTYEARYAVEYKGRSVGESLHRITHDAESGRYRFESVTKASGLAKLIRPKPAVEQSDFVLEDGTIKPIEFRYEDGSRKGEDNIHVSFASSRNQAEITTDGGSRQVPLEPGVLDRGTLQVALMLDLAADEHPEPHTVVDADSLKTYRYSVDGRETIATPAGSHETIKLTQRRDGSSRETIVWAAPALCYLPVRIEQRRDGEVWTTLVLESVQGL